MVLVISLVRLSSRPSVRLKTTGEIFGQEIQYLNSIGLLLVEVPTSSVAISGIRSYLLGWLKEGDFL